MSPVSCNNLQSAKIQIYCMVYLKLTQYCKSTILQLEKKLPETCLVVQWVRLYTLNAGMKGSILGQDPVQLNK